MIRLNDDKKSWRTAVTWQSHDLLVRPHTNWPTYSIVFQHSACMYLYISGDIHHSCGRQQLSSGRMFCLQGRSHVQHGHYPDEDLPVETYYLWTNCSYSPT